MLVLKRRDGQWVEVTHRSGDVMRIRICKSRAGHHPQLDLAFEDDARNFSIQRPERFLKNNLVQPEDAIAEVTI